jgi:hypothetical protein
MDTIDQGYIVDNRRHAERILTVLEGRRLFTAWPSAEDEEFCRRSAQELRGLLEAQMLTIEAGGFLIEMINDVRKACRIFVDAAGRDAVNFCSDFRLFEDHLATLRMTVALRVGRIVDEFQLTVSVEIQEIMGHRP